MLETLPISPSSNNGFSENPRGVRGSEKDAGGFQSFFEAASAARRDSGDSSESAIEEKSDEKADCREKSASSKNSGSPVKSDSGSSKKEKSDKDVTDKEAKEAEDSEAGTSADNPETIPLQDDSQQTAAPGMWLGGSGEEPISEKGDTSESPEGEISLPGNPGGSSGGNPQNPVVEKENDIRVVAPLKDGETARPESAGAENVPLKGASPLNPEGQPNPEASKQLTGEKAEGESLTGTVAKSLVGGSEGLSAEPENRVGVDGEQNISVESGAKGATREGTQPLVGATAKNTQSDAAADTVQGRSHLESPRSGKFSYEPRIPKESGKTENSEKGLFPSSKGLDFSQKETDKPMASVGKEKFETMMAARGGHKARVKMGDKETASKESTNSKALEGNAAGTKDTVSISKNGVSSAQVRPAMDSIPMDIKHAEQNDPRQKDAALKAGETSGQVADIRETETHSSKPGSDNREDSAEAEKRSAQGKTFHAVAEKVGLTKEADVITVSKARYASDTSTVAVETDKEVQKPSAGKEGLGPLVRTAAFLLKNGRQEVKMALHPESLGHLKIRISTENHQVTVRFMAETSAAKELIEHNLHQLKADFQSQGLEIQKFDVSLSQDSGRNGAGYNPSSAGNRTRDKAGSKREENLRRDEESSRIASTARSAVQNGAVDFFA